MNHYYRINISPELLEEDRKKLFHILSHERATIQSKEYYYEVWISDHPKGGIAPDITVSLTPSSILIQEIGIQTELREELYTRAQTLSGYTFTPPQRSKTPEP